MTELRPCPFCGKASIEIVAVDDEGYICAEEYADRYVARCIYCGANVEDISPEYAAERWNGRASV